MSILKCNTRHQVRKSIVIFFAYRSRIYGIQTKGYISFIALSLSKHSTQLNCGTFGRQSYAFYFNGMKSFPRSTYSHIRILHSLYTTIKIHRASIQYSPAVYICFLVSKVINVLLFLIFSNLKQST